MSLAPGARLGPYEILSPLGAGGMGEVYRARDTRLDREVAVKVLPEAFAADAERLARFETEAKAVAALTHPNILSIHDYGNQEGVVYAVMELLSGRTLQDRLDSGPVSQKRAIEYALQVTEGLSAAHEKGIVHRDIKPANLFLTEDGHVKILDFGLAKRSQGVEAEAETIAPASRRTTAGEVMGTMDYMSPEQARGEDVDARSDLFSLTPAVGTRTKPSSGSKRQGNTRTRACPRSRWTGCSTTSAGIRVGCRFCAASARRPGNWRRPSSGSRFRVRESRPGERS